MGHMVDIEVTLTAPISAGRYVSYFRLITPDNHRFGMRLWCDITVEGSLSASVKASIAKPLSALASKIVESHDNKPNADKYEKWAKEISQLSELGFYDIDKNCALLEKKSTIQDVIEELLSQKSNQ